MRLSLTPKSLVITGIAVTAASALVALLAIRLLAPDDDGDTRAAAAFARAWTGGTLATLEWDPRSGADPAGQVARATAALTPADPDRPAQVRVAAVRRAADSHADATADLDVRWDLRGTAWTYRSHLALHRAGDAWRPVLSPPVVHPELGPGRVLRTTVEPAPRGALLDRAGAPIVQDRAVVTVGLEPRRAAGGLAVTVAQVAPLVGVADQPALVKRASAAAPDAFVEVVTLRRGAYDAVRDRLRPIPGVVLREGVRQLAPTTEFARALLGAVGPATAEIVAAGGGKVAPDQQVGLSGLQKQYEGQLAGTPGLFVEAVAAPTAPPADPPLGAPAQVQTGPQGLFRAPAVPGKALGLTLDQAVQVAADAALTGSVLPTALVAVSVSSGDVLAVANNGPDGPGYDRALTGRYPPGSTFKVASTLALLRTGLQPTELVPCPAVATVSGKQFTNAGGEVLGQVPFTEDFADSCNTAFVGTAGRVTSAQLAASAEALGYDQGQYAAPTLGLPAFGAQVPVTADPVQHAAQLIGQGEVLVSPLAVAVSSAAVASGSLHPPRVLAATPAAPPGPALAEAPTLRQLMRLVVTSGTGTALLRVPGGEVSGKTGTAEFGSRVPPQTHAWFTGFQGDVAFAVLVEGGGFGGAVAAPLAAAFLTALAGG